MAIKLIEWIIWRDRWIKYLLTCSWLYLTHIWQLKIKLESDIVRGSEGEKESEKEVREILEVGKEKETWKRGSGGVEKWRWEIERDIKKGMKRRERRERGRGGSERRRKWVRLRVWEREKKRGGKESEMVGNQDEGWGLCHLENTILLSTILKNIIMKSEYIFNRLLWGL